MKFVDVNMLISIFLIRHSLYLSGYLKIHLWNCDVVGLNFKSLSPLLNQMQVEVNYSMIENDL